MIVGIIVSIFILVLIGVLLYSLVKTVIKAIFIEILLICGILVLLWILLFVDLNNYRENFLSSENVFFYEKNGEIITGYTVIGLSDAESFHALSENEIVYFNNLYKSEDFKTMRGDNFKLIIIKKDSFESLTKPIVIANQEFTKEFIMELIEHPEPVELLVKSQFVDPEDEAIQEYKDTLGDKNRLKSELFYSLLLTSLDENNVKFIVSEFKQKNIKIYPVTPIFHAVKVIPEFVSQKIASMKT